MRREALVLACLALAGLGPAAPAAAQSMVVHQRLVGLVEPAGAEHMIALGARARLFESDDLLLRDAHVEAGVIDYLSPIDTILGGYLQMSPIAFLVLRAELGAHAMWPLGSDGAGFYPQPGYDAELGDGRLAGARGRPALGSHLQLAATLQGAIQLGPIRPIVGPSSPWSTSCSEPIPTTTALATISCCAARTGSSA